MSDVEFNNASLGQDLFGRLWDVLVMLRVAAAQSEGSELRFSLYVAMPDRGNWQPNEEVPERGCEFTRDTHRKVELKALCGPGDTAEPVITVMLPSED